MNWSMLAGGLSQGLEKALGGATQGAMQGEQVRHQRAGEDLQQQHLQMQQQQLTNTLAQQAFQNRMAQERFGLTQKELGLRERGLEAESGYRDWQRRQGERKLGLEESMQPYTQGLLEAKTKYYNNPMGRSSGTERERWKNDQAMRMGFASYYDPSITPDIRAQIDRQYEVATPFGMEKRNQYASLEQRRGLLNQLTQSVIANPPLSGADQVKRSIVLAKARAYSDAMRNANQQGMLGQPPLPQDRAIIDSIDFIELIGELDALSKQVEQRGASAAAPSGAPMPSQAPVAPTGPTTGRDALMGKWGLK